MAELDYIGGSSANSDISDIFPNCPSEIDIEEPVNNYYFCVVCYEPYEKIVLTAAEAETIFRVMCKVLRVERSKTAFDINCGTDFPLCECCSEFAIGLVRLHKRLEAIKEKIQTNVEEVIETIIESELARKQKILKIRDSKSNYQDIKYDARVDGFRQQVIISCEDVAHSPEAREPNKCALYDGDYEDENKYANIFKNFKIRKEIFECNSWDDEKSETLPDTDVCGKDNTTTFPSVLKPQSPLADPSDKINKNDTELTKSSKDHPKSNTVVDVDIAISSTNFLANEDIQTKNHNDIKDHSEEDTIVPTSDGLQVTTDSQDKEQSSQAESDDDIIFISENTVAKDFVHISTPEIRHNDTVSEFSEIDTIITDDINSISIFRETEEANYSGNTWEDSISDITTISDDNPLNNDEMDAIINDLELPSCINDGNAIYSNITTVATDERINAVTEQEPNYSKHTWEDSVTDTSEDTVNSETEIGGSTEGVQHPDDCTEKNNYAETTVATEIYAAQAEINHDSTLEGKQRNDITKNSQSKTTTVNSDVFFVEPKIRNVINEIYKSKDNTSIDLQTGIHSHLKGTESSVQVEINSIIGKEQSIGNTGVDEFLTLNYIGPAARNAESDTDSNETTVFTNPPKSKYPKVSFERILKKSPSDVEDNDEENSGKTSKSTDVPATTEFSDMKVNKETLEAIDTVETPLKKSRFSWGAVQYKDGTAFFQDIEIILLNKEKTRVKCSLCKIITKNTKGKKAMIKMRTHIVAAHCGIYICPICKKRCHDNSNLQEHVKSHGEKYTPENGLVCQICSHVCLSSPGLMMHMKKVHGDQVPTDNAKANIASPSKLMDKVPTAIARDPDFENVGNKTITVEKKRGVGRPPGKRSEIYSRKGLVGSSPALTSQSSLPKRAKLVKTFDKMSSNIHSTTDTETATKTFQSNREKTLFAKRTALPPTFTQKGGRPKRKCAESLAVINITKSTSIPEESATDQKRTVPYPAKNFTENLSSEEISSVKSTRVDPLLVESNPIVPIKPPESLTVNRMSTTSTINNQPESTDLDLTRSDTDENGDNPLPIAKATSHTSLVAKAVPQLVLLTSVGTHSSSTYRSILPKPIDVAKLAAVSKEITVQTNQIISQTINNLFSSSSAIPPAPTKVLKASTYIPIPRKAGARNSLLPTPRKPSLEKQGLKVVEIVRNSSNYSVPVAVLTSGTTNLLSCSACGFTNEQHENQASALREIKIHIYQKHFFTNPGQV